MVLGTTVKIILQCLSGERGEPGPPGPPTTGAFNAEDSKILSPGKN